MTKPMNNAEWEEWRKYERAFLATQPYKNSPFPSRLLFAVVVIGLLLIFATKSSAITPQDLPKTGEINCVVTENNKYRFDLVCEAFMSPTPTCAPDEAHLLICQQPTLRIPYHELASRFPAWVSPRPKKGMLLKLRWRHGRAGWPRLEAVAKLRSALR
jgi:hypothetical protein